MSVYVMQLLCLLFNSHSPRLIWNEFFGFKQHIQVSHSYSNPETQHSVFASASVHTVDSCNSCRWKHIYASNQMFLCLLIKCRSIFCWFHCFQLELCTLIKGSDSTFWMCICSCC